MVVALGVAVGAESPPGGGTSPKGVEGDPEEAGGLEREEEPDEREDRRGVVEDLEDRAREVDLEEHACEDRQAQDRNRGSERSGRTE